MDARVERPVTQETVQVIAKPRRRTYTAEYKRRILKEADACTAPGTIGALLRREGLYSSLLVEWHRVAYERKADGKREIGVIAEEVGAVVPEVVVFEENGVDARSVDYARLVAVPIEAVKQQQGQVKELQDEIRLLKARLLRGELTRGQ